VVHHGPSGETWVLAAVDGAHVYPAGWPPSRAEAADCTLVEAADDEAHVRMVAEATPDTGDFSRRWQLANAHDCDACRRARAGVTP
jgi:hypothetical protein